MDDRPALLFDFGGTLDADGVAWGERFFRAYEHAGGALGEARFQAIFRRSDELLPTVVRGCGFRATVDRQAALIDALLPPGDHVDVAGMADRFHRDALGVVKRNLPMLERLSRGFTLGLVSNFSGNLEECVAELGLRRLLAVATDSCAVGIAKPEHGIFACALAAIGVGSERAWFVGDNPERDIRPAAEMGMRTFWVAPACRPTPRGLEPTRRVACLLELEALVTS